jgi:hypothetical protein
VNDNEGNGARKRVAYAGKQAENGVPRTATSGLLARPR